MIIRQFGVMKKIKIIGAREHNLKNISVEIPAYCFTVITGLSGSGKSSLAFDTLYAEGQRRYVESLSSYARQFLERLKRPDVDYIEGLFPAIAIEQRKLSHNPRSIVATQTEIYDYLRLLFAHLGMVKCYSCGRVMQKQTSQQIVESIMSKQGLKAQILSPVIRGRKGQFVELFSDIQREGFVRVRVDGVIYPLEEVPKLDRYKIHNIDIVIDRVVISQKARSRITEAVELALKISSGIVIVLFHDKEGNSEVLFSENLSCPYCGISYPEVEPRLFSFNSPYGACPSCNGLGVSFEIDENKVVPDKTKSLQEGAIAPWRKGARGYLMYYKRLLREFCYLRGIDMTVPFYKLERWQQKEILYGSAIELWGGKKFEGIIPHLLRLFRETESVEMKSEITKYMRETPCPECKGARLRKESLYVFIEDKNIWDICKMDISSALRFLQSLKFSGAQKKISELILREAMKRLEFCEKTGVGYIQLNRLNSTLSGGEAQRIRLATQIGSGLTGVLYVLDEPSIGLHPRDTEKLISSLKALRDAGNTLVVVEHDASIIMNADFVVDLGPGAGEEGGRVIFAGRKEELLRSKESLTAKYLNGTFRIKVPLSRREPKDFLVIKGAEHNNLKKIDVKIPLGVFVCITGVSGSGKSSLIYDVLYKGLKSRLYGAIDDSIGKHKDIIGWEKIDKVIMIDQDPIGRTPRSNPATYTDLFTHIRRLFSQLPQAKARGFKPGRFSFNVKGGRCQACKGEGMVKIEMHFLPDVYLPCSVCGGSRYNQQTLQVKYKGYSIADVLNMSVEEARDLFSSIPSIKRILDTLYDVGLGYIKLGQPATTLSGGEAQRVKLASELARKSTGKTLYILDEPTIGLHFADEERLLAILHRLVDMGNSVVVIEHNLDMIKTADWVIDLGPEGGDKGGFIVAQGRPEDICKVSQSYTGRFLRRVLYD